FYTALWLLITVQLPHHETDWTALIPGALVFGIGLELVQVVIAYFITPYALAKQGTYGALGVAAALLVGLFLISRLVVASAVLNATIWARQSPPGGSALGRSCVGPPLQLLRGPLPQPPGRHPV